MGTIRGKRFRVLGGSPAICSTGPPNIGALISRIGFLRVPLKGSIRATIGIL